ncbi:phage portal protein [Salipiger pacificus]|nr:phage portal protein [Alloyangia pacifica]
MRFPQLWKREEATSGETALAETRVYTPVEKVHADLTAPDVPEDRMATAAEIRDISAAMNWSNWSSGTHTPAGSQSALRFSAAWAAVNILCQDVSKLPLNLYRKRPGGGRDLVTNHPVARLLKRPNPWQTRLEFVRQLVLSMLLDGNGYALIERDGAARPVALIPVLPHRCQALQNEVTLELFYRLGGVSRPIDQRPVVPGADMIHVRWLSVDGIIGLSALTAARVGIETGLTMEGHARDLFKNGARPSGILSVPKRLTKDAAERIKAAWQAAYGSGNAGRTAVLEEGAEWKGLTFSSVDAQFLEQRKFSVTEIARIFRIPPHMLADLEKATFNNVEQSQAAYYRDTLMPILELLEASLSLAFDLSDDMVLEFEVDRLLRADTRARYETHRIAREWGLKTGNEIRIEEGMNPTEGGEILFAPLNMGDARNPQKREEPAPTEDEIRAAVKSAFEGTNK